MRSFWSGEIAFGLVTITAKLYTATKDLTPQFHQLHKEDGGRVTMVRRCTKCHRDLAWDEIGKGYEVSKGEYALFMPMTTEQATVGGRETFGEPKKIGTVAIEIDGDSITASLERMGFPLADVRGTLGSGIDIAVTLAGGAERRTIAAAFGPGGAGMR